MSYINTVVGSITSSKVLIKENYKYLNFDQMKELNRLASDFQCDVAKICLKDR